MDSESNTLAERLATVFANDGPLADTLPAFEPRPGQRQMATAVADVFESDGVLLAQAGTGTGKTLAYLVPAVLSGKRVLISTGTKNLQDQIYYKDLPTLRDALGTPFTATYMKGRANYLCLHRFSDIHDSSETRPPVERAYLEIVGQWAGQTDTGDRAELEELPDDVAIWNEISATSENCIGSDCPDYDQCFITRMRQRASESDIVIVNHHLFCADAAVRQSAYGEVIPSCSYIVIDEAHQLEDVTTQYFGVVASNFRLETLIQDINRFLMSLPDNNVQAKNEIQAAINQTKGLAKEFFSSLILLNTTTDLSRITANTLSPVDDSARQLIASLGKLHAALKQVTEHSEDLADLTHRIDELHAQLEFLLNAKDPDYVYFLEIRGKGVFLRASPIDVSSIVNEVLIQRYEGIVLTSATLAVDESFDYIRGRLGITNSFEMNLPSEFDFRQQSVLYLPTQMPDPRNEQFPLSVANELTRLLAVTKGRAFLLFTSYANLYAVQNHLSAKCPYPLLTQGSAPRTALLREFRNTPNAVLLATSSFWQGVDVVGETLSCVVIDKLPFASPRDPIIAARMEAIETQGGNPFSDYQVPLAILTLLQGLGRLIRHRHDRGVLALLDPRIKTKNYGQRFLASLPPSPITHDLKVVKAFFDSDDKQFETITDDRGSLR